MAEIRSKIPKRLQWLFWSSPVKDLDLKKDKDYIISQVLNYGTWEDLRWLFKNYSERGIKNVVRNPQKGLWFRDVLNFWNLIFNLKMEKKIFEKAILDLEKYVK